MLINTIVRGYTICGGIRRWTEFLNDIAVRVASVPDFGAQQRLSSPWQEAKAPGACFERRGDKLSHDRGWPWKAESDQQRIIK